MKLAVLDIDTSLVYLIILNICVQLRVSIDIPPPLLKPWSEEGI